MEKLLGELTAQELARGYYKHASGRYICCLCGEEFEPGQVYPMEGRFYDAEHAAQRHVEAHGGAFEALLKLDRRFTGLTDNQENLLRLMHEGRSDADIAAQLGVSPSTVRHQRFMFREKAKQAKAYLALFELSVGRATPQADQTVPVHSRATMVDDRYQVTRGEEQAMLKAAFESFSPLRLRAFPRKEKKKIVVLRRIAQEFAPGEAYTEKQVSAVLRDVYPDFATLRRYLIEYGFMKRSPDGSRYLRCDEEGGENP